jgi:Zn-dependent protease with chaperone function
MSYENPPVPHEVNVSREGVLAEFLRLAAGLAICVLALSVFLYLAGGWLARFVPFQTEVDWVGDKVLGIGLLGTDAPTDAAESARIQTYLDGLTRSVAATMALPAGMTVRAHLAESDVPNAFATLGGHIVVTRGLYRRMPSENALTLVIGHEIGHIKARDPISAVGGSAMLGLILVVAGADVNALAPSMARLVQLGYSRRAETRADTEALAGVRALYGHAGGAASVFRMLGDYRREVLDIDVPNLLSTHPADAQRIARMQAAAGDWNESVPLTPLSVKIAAKEGANDP